MDSENEEELDFRAQSVSHMSLAKNILKSVLGMQLTKELCEKLEQLYLLVGNINKKSSRGGGIEQIDPL